MTTKQKGFLAGIFIGLLSILCIAAGNGYFGTFTGSFVTTGSTGAGYVLQDTLGNGTLSMAAPSGGGNAYTNGAAQNFFQANTFRNALTVVGVGTFQNTLTAQGTFNANNAVNVGGDIVSTAEPDGTDPAYEINNDGSAYFYSSTSSVYWDSVGNLTTGSSLATGSGGISSVGALTVTSPTSQSVLGGSLTVDGSLAVSNNSTIQGTETVVGNVTMKGNLIVHGLLLATNFDYYATGIQATQTTPIYTNNTGGYVQFYGHLVSTVTGTAASATVTPKWTWTNELGSASATGSSISCATTAANNLDTDMVVSNTTVVSIVETLGGSGTPTFNIRGGIQPW